MKGQVLAGLPIVTEGPKTILLELTVDEFETLSLLAYRYLAGVHPTRASIEVGLNTVQEELEFSPMELLASDPHRIEVRWS